MAVRLVPQDRQASWDSHKWLAFTPPASLSSAQIGRRVSQGLPGGAGKLTQPDNSALRLPPLTPPGAEASTLPPFGPLPGGSAMPFASGSANPTLGRAASPLDLGLGSHPAGSNTPGTAAAELDTLSASLLTQQAPEQQGKALNSAQSVIHAAASAAICNQVLPSKDDQEWSGHEQIEAGLTPMPLHPQEQQQPADKPHGAGSAMQQQKRHASTAGDDTGQVGPPITRMRPALPPASSSSAGKKSIGKQQAAADSLQSTADAILFDALLCGWEQQTNDGVSVIAMT